MSRMPRPAPQFHRSAARRAATLLLVLASLLMLTLTGCSESAAAPSTQRPLPTVTVSQPLRRQVVEWDDYMGRLAPVESVEIRSRVSGYLREIKFTDGETVKKDQLLFVIDPRPFESALDRARAAVQQAKADVTRAKADVVRAEATSGQAQAAYELATLREERGERMRDLSAMAQEELDQRRSDRDQALADRAAAVASIKLAEANVAVAEAQLANAESEKRTAEIQLGYTRIIAPIEGRISRHMVSEGNLVAGGEAGSTLLTTIVATSPVHAYFDADERELLNYIRLDRSGRRESSRKVKNPVYLALADEDTFGHEGHMDFVDNRVDPATGSIRGRAVFRNPDGVLIPGLFARVRVPGTAPYEATLVPPDAIAFDQTQEIVYVVVDTPPKSSDQSNAAGSDSNAGEANPPPPDAKFIERRVVTTGPLAFGLRIVRDGLAPDERVVIGGLVAARPGVAVSVREGTIEADETNAMPDSYEPWPEERWIRGPDPSGAALPGPDFSPPNPSAADPPAEPSPKSDDRSDSAPTAAPSQSEG